MVGGPPGAALGVAIVVCEGGEMKLGMEIMVSGDRFGGLVGERGVSGVTDSGKEGGWMWCLVENGKRDLKRGRYLRGVCGEGRSLSRT